MTPILVGAAAVIPQQRFDPKSCRHRTARVAASGSRGGSVLLSRSLKDRFFDMIEGRLMNINGRGVIVLTHLIEKDGRRLSEMPEVYRQAVIDLGMREPPLVEVEGDWVTATAQGREALAQ